MELVIPCKKSAINIDASPLYPLSYAQERMWFLHKYHNKNDKHYNVSIKIDFFGELNIPALEKSLNKIIERHEAFRSVFVESEEGVFQKILPYKKNILSQEKASSQNDADAIISKEISKIFDIENESLIRLKLFKLNDQHHILLVNQHHIIYDGWSLSIFNKELFLLYQYYSQNKAPFLPALPIQYKEFSQIQRNALLSGKFLSQSHYWISKLKDVPQLNLPTDYARPVIQTHNGRRHFFPISLELLECVKTLALKLNLTIYMVFLSAFYVLLSRYSNQKDIVIGSAISNRDKKTQDLIGLFTNTVALRIQENEVHSVEDLLFNIKKNLSEAIANKDIPFEYIINQLNLPRTTDKQPIFQNMFIYYYADEDSLTWNLPNLKTEIHEIGAHTSKYDFTFNFQRTKNGISSFIEYNTDIYHENTIINMSEHFVNLLKEITNNPKKMVHLLNFITKKEQDAILNQWNSQLTFFNEKCLIHELFEKHAKLTPNNPAIFFGHKTLTYEALNTKANQLAHYLHKIGIQPEEAIAVSMHRSLDLTIVLMAILKTGAAYVPLDPNYPKIRLQYMLENSNAKILITEDCILNSLELKTSGKIILVENIFELTKSEKEENLKLNLSENSLAIIHYTSGSTGNPKGVMLEHAALCYCFKWLQSTFPLKPNEKMLQHTLYSFDVFICELFWPLIFGASSVLVEPEQERDTSVLTNLINQHHIKTTFCVPSMLSLFLENKDFSQCTSLKNVLSTGEALPIALKDLFYKRSSASLYNLYGPTESTIFTSYEYCEPKAKSITIGRSISDKQVFILDKRGELQPVGIPGELCVGGRVARGYYNIPELSLKRFFTHQFNHHTYRLYNTGDIARYLHDGSIEYLGRSDFQVKFQGHRIELTEIETYLNQYPHIEKCVVDLKKFKNDDFLVGYYTTAYNDPSSNAHQLRDYLSECLPNYMIPSFFIKLDHIPLTPSGKIDKKALPELTDENILHTNHYVAPRNDFEFKLIKILESILNINKIGIHDDFFQIGGTSLMAVRFILSIKYKFSKTVPFSLLFKKGTVAEIAKYLNIRVQDLISHTIFPIHQRNAGGTLFLAHPVEGLSYLYSPLSAHLKNHSLYGLNNPYFYNRDKTFNSIEEMASHYVEAIKTIQSQGPYYLCGWSSGGQVAYEMAIQLKKQNFDVAAVILIDTFHHKNINVTLGDLNIRIPRVLQSEGIDPESEEGRYFALEYRQNVALLKRYAAKLYDGRVILIKAQEVDKHIEDDPYNGWQPYISTPIKVYSVPGEHSRLLDAEYIENIASALDKILLSVANIFSYDFYSNKGKEILIEKNYPDSIKTYLLQEHNQLVQFISNRNHYTALFEIGCGDARNIDIATKTHINYYGIDFIPDNIEKAQKRIEKLGNKINALAKCVSIFDLNEETNFIPENEKALVFFPFNSIGNMENIIPALKTIISLGYDIVFSIFKTTQETNLARFEYYQNCGFSNLKCHEHENGIEFTSSEGLKSIAYSEDYLRSLIEALHCQVTLISECDIGRQYYVPSLY